MYVCKPISFSQREDNDPILLCIGFQLEIAIFEARLGLNSTCPRKPLALWFGIEFSQVCMNAYFHIDAPTSPDKNTYIVQSVHYVYRY